MAKLMVKEIVARHGTATPRGQESIEQKINTELEKIRGEVLDIKFQYYSTPNGAEGTYAWIIYKVEG